MCAADAPEVGCLNDRLARKKTEFEVSFTEENGKRTSREFMKAVLVLVAAAAAVVTAGPGHYGHGGGVGLSGGGIGLSGGGGGGYGGYGAEVDLSAGYSDYHFSWRHDGGKNYDWHSANYYCSSLGPGWQGVSIETKYEDSLISKVIYQDNVKYIWTSGFRQGYNWRWGSGNPFYGLNWSHTGATGHPQPDNYENGKEFCHAVLNNFYKDGIRWHDVACHHEKPIVCERPRIYGGVGSSVGVGGVGAGGHGGSGIPYGSYGYGK